MIEGRRVVITGMGTINPLGHSIEETWAAIKAGKSGVERITQFDTSDYKVKIAGAVKNFVASEHMDKKEARKMALFTQYAVAAAIQAYKDAGLKEGNFDPHRTATILGNGIGGIEVLSDAVVRLHEKGPDAVPPLTIPKMITNEGPGQIAIALGLYGPCYTVATACSSATDAIGAAFRSIKYGESDVAVTGGSEASIVPLAVSGFSKLQTLATSFNDDPAKASRPFDKDREGFVLGEGSAVLVLEELEHAKKRGATIYGEIKGYGISCDAYHTTSPDPEGAGCARAMQLALEEANLKPEDIQYINAHGTSTPINDPVESKAIRDTFGDHAYKLNVSSTKSMTAHMVGAAGAMEAVICTLAINDSFVPCTLNLDEPGEGCDLNYTPHKGEEKNIDNAISNSLGFGGHNGTILISKYKD